MPLRSSELFHKGLPTETPNQSCPICFVNTKTAHLTFAKSNIHWEQGSAQAPREIRGSSAIEQIRFLKEATPGEHLRDKDHKSTDRLRAHYGCRLWFLVS